MNFWYKIRRWLGVAPAGDGGKTQSNASSGTPGTVVRVETNPPDLPDSGNTAVDLIQLLFSTKDKHITTMVNSITLSSDMKTLFLIDNGRSISYDLTVPEGVMVGLMGDQLVAATAVAPPALGTSGSVKTAGNNRYTFKALDNSQYTMSYNESNKAIAIIGVGDIVINLEAPDSNDCASRC
ncbi:MAG: hypothetical protein R2795_16915 [Saprospiraceae bacterium]